MHISSWILHRANSTNDLLHLVNCYKMNRNCANWSLNYSGVYVILFSRSDIIYVLYFDTIDVILNMLCISLPFHGIQCIYYMWFLWLKGHVHLLQVQNNIFIKWIIDPQQRWVWMTILQYLNYLKFNHYLYIVNIEF